jgi:hypothetical protein
MIHVDCDMRDMKQVVSTAFHPQTEGQTKITIRSLEDMLRHYVAQNQTDWEMNPPGAEFAVDNAWHDTISR